MSVSTVPAAGPLRPQDAIAAYHRMPAPKTPTEQQTAAALLDVDLPPEADDIEEAPLPLPRRLLDLPPAEPLGFAIDGLVVAGEINALVGDGDAGKSSVLYAGAGAVAAGACAYGERIVRPGPVLFVSGEDSAHLIRNRLKALAAGHGWDRALTLGNVHVYDEGVDLDDPRWQARLIAAACDLKVVLACFDPLADLCGERVDENSNTDARRITRYLRTFIRRTGATPWIAMHVSKPAEGKTDRKQRVRGASGWKNAARMVWWAEACDGGIELEPIKANRLARPKTLRLKRTVTADPDHPLMWRTAHLALDTEGDVVHGDVIAVLAYVRACRAAPSGREIEDGAHGLSRDRARAALGVGRTRQWLEAVDGPRRSKLWSLTETGHARLLLAN